MFMWSSQNKNSNEHINQPIKATNNRNFYALMISNTLIFNDSILTREQAQNKLKMWTEQKAQPLSTPFCNKLGSEVSGIFSWPSPLPAYSKIISVQTRILQTITKYHDTYVLTGNKK